MKLTRWDPFRELSILQDRVNRAFNEQMSRSEGDDGGTWGPVVDILETKSDLIVRAELPGMKKEDIDVEVTGESLTIRGERKEPESEDQRFIRVERPTGQFVRSFTIGVPVQPDKVKAAYKDGVLEITVPKAEEVKPKKIDIKTD